MIMTRIDPLKLEAVAILRKSGMAAQDIRRVMRISRATYQRRVSELKRIEEEAKKLMNNDA